MGGKGWEGWSGVKGGNGTTVIASSINVFKKSYCRSEISHAH